jgi:hypothetical protein
LSEKGRKRKRVEQGSTETEIEAASIEKVPARVPRDPSARNDRSA